MFACQPFMLFITDFIGSSTGNGPMPNAKNTKGADALAGWNLKGSGLTPEKPTAVPNMSVVPQQATTDEPAPGASQKLPTYEQQGKFYTQTPIQITPEPLSVRIQSKDPAHTAETPPEPAPAPAGTQPSTFGPAPVLPHANVGPDPEALLHGKYLKYKPLQRLSAGDEVFTGFNI